MNQVKIIVYKVLYTKYGNGIILTKSCYDDNYGNFIYLYDIHYIPYIIKTYEEILQHQKPSSSLFPNQMHQMQLNAIN